MLRVIFQDSDEGFVFKAWDWSGQSVTFEKIDRANRRNSRAIVVLNDTRFMVV